MEKQGNNAYFEQEALKMMGGLSEDEVVQRISDCQMVVERLASDPVWKLVIEDARKWVERLDSNWQEIEDEKQRNYARVLKFAYLHVRELPNKYKADLENAKMALDSKRSTATKIQRDYDQETNLEQK